MRIKKYFHEKTRWVLLSGALLIAGGLMVWAQSGPAAQMIHQGFGMHGNLMPAMIQTHVQQVVKELGLSDQQKAQIREILAANRDKLTADLKGISDAHKALHTQAIQSTGNLTAADLMPQSDAIAQAVAQTAADFAVLRLQVQTVLTPEQKAKADTFHQQMSGDLAGHQHSGALFDAVVNALK